MSFCYRDRGDHVLGDSTTMKGAALVTLVLLTATSPALARPHHGHHYVTRATHHASRSGVGESHSGITCEMVRAYVAKVGLAQATAMAESAGMTSSEKERARRCLAEKS
jgi:hypothetical protein